MDNITSIIGCCKREKSNCSETEVVVKAGVENDEVEMANDEEENEIYLSDDEDAETDEVYLSDEEDTENDEDGMEETELMKSN